MTEPRLGEVVSVRFTTDELAHFRLIADGRPVSHIVRDLATRKDADPSATTVSTVNLAHGWFTCNHRDISVAIRSAIVSERGKRLVQ